MALPQDRKGTKGPADKRFEREEMGALLKMFSSLGITVAVGIVAAFLLGIWLDDKLVEMGYATRGAVRIVCTLGGLGISLYWAYLRITKHLKTFDRAAGNDREPDGGA
ncbi:MAG: AtpZ/AtpI family protein [Planctomycetes bacterium]|nr:AtpZ/AtpI family protein [Planctomycetota bacterium]